MDAIVLRRIRGYRNAFYGKVDRPVFEYEYVGDDGLPRRDVAQVLSRRFLRPGATAEIAGKEGVMATVLNPRTFEPETVVVRRLAVRVAGGVVRVFLYDPSGIGDLTSEEIAEVLRQATEDGTAIAGLTAAEVISERRERQA